MKRKPAQPPIWTVIWLFLLLTMAAFITFYWGMPGDGATGDLNSFIPEGYLVQWVIDERPGGLRVGDVILRANGYTPEEWLRGEAQAGDAWEAGETVSYRVRRGGEEIELPVELQPLPFSALWRHWGLQFIGILSLTVIGSFVFWQRPGYTAAQWFMVFCLVNAIQMVADGWNFQFVLFVRPALFRFHLANEHTSYAFIWVAGIMEALSFPKRYGVLDKYQPQIVAIAAIIFIGGAFYPIFFSPSLSAGLHTSNQVVVSFASVYLFIASALIVHTYRRTRDPLAREQVRLWIYIAVGVALIAVPFYYLPIILRGQPILPHPFTSAIVLVLLPMAFALGILGIRMYEVEFIINRSLVYGALTGVLAVLFAGSLFLISLMARSLTGSEQSLIAVAVSAATFGALFQPARRSVRRFVDLRLFGIAIDYADAVQKYQRDTDSSSYPAQHIQVGSYTSIQRIGTGGMAIIYKARDPKHKRLVALKLLTAHLLNDERARFRFTREVETLAALDHPNILRLYDFGEVNQIPYMALEFIEGIPLSDYLKTRAPLSLEAALPLISDTAEALDYLHDQGLVHRDVKPSNIMLDMPKGENGPINRAVIMDFGVAKSVTGDYTRLTFAGLLGSFEYIAPEQIESAAEVDRRADVYSLGISVYQMLTGVLPFQSRNPGALLIAHLQTEPLDPRHICPELDKKTAAVLLRALEKEPSQRYDTAGEFFRALAG